jgi:TetR/AcrR family transcriptional repressor of nem operon
MARPREFDPDNALKDALNVFWEHGYDAASLRELLAGMGLTRGSLYKAFADKKSLFLKVLNRYEVEAVQSAVTHLTTGPKDGVVRIKTLFASVIETAQAGDRRGCLLCSAAAGPAAVDEDIAEIVHAQLGVMQQAFDDALAQSQAWEKVDSEERGEAACLLLSQYVGVRVLVRSNAPIAEIQRCVNALQRIMG